MASNALVQTRIDAAVKERATAVLENMGLTGFGCRPHLANPDRE